MATAEFTMKELIEAGVHFGHKTKRWNPKMAPFIYGVRNDTHIIDLNKTVPLLQNALQAVFETARAGGKILFVGTKRQASDVVAETARGCGHYYVNNRWLGGMLTNWNTIQNSIRRMSELEDQLEHGQSVLTKKELLNIERNRDKLERSLGGIRKMGTVPNLIFIIDVVHEDLALKEAAKLNIPVAAIVDTNADIANVDFPIPGNDDATKAIRLYCDLIAQTIRKGMQAGGFEVKAVEEKPKQVEAKDTKASEKADDKTSRSTTRKEAMAAAAKLAGFTREENRNAS